MVTGKPVIAIVGGGMGGVETAASLRNHLDDEARIVMVSETPELQLRPFFIYPPFSNLFKNRNRTHLDLRKPAARRGIEFQEWTVEEIDTDTQHIRGKGNSLEFDHLVIATGAGMRPSEVPGLSEHAYTIWGFDDSLRLAEAVERMVERAVAGERQKVLFNVAEGNKCAGPLYEMVFMLETYLRRKKVRDSFEIVWTTSEDSYIQAFGPKLHEATVKELAERGIAGHTGCKLDRVEPNAAHYRDGTTLDFDWMIAFPPYVAHTHFDNLPVDDRGFIHADQRFWNVLGQENIYAIGDGADFPVKQAFLALGMAGVVAHNLANQVKGMAATETFDPVSMCIMEQLDTGLYAQVPLELTGDPFHPVRVRPQGYDDYVVRDSRLWQMGKWGMYAMMVLQMGRMHTFHEGPLWTGMDVMIKGMQKIP